MASDSAQDGAVQDPLEYAGESGSFEDVSQFVKVADLGADTLFNAPPISFLHEGWSTTGYPITYPWEDQTTLLNSTPASPNVSGRGPMYNQDLGSSAGFIITDPQIEKVIRDTVGATASSGASSFANRTKKYGFRFHFNPPTFSEGYSKPFDVNFMQYLQRMSQTEVPLPSMNSGGNFSLDLLLARYEDVRILQGYTVDEISGTDLSSRLYRSGLANNNDVISIRNQGTLYDLEYLFRVANGDPLTTWRGDTADWGMLLPSAVVVSVGNSTGARKLRAIMQSVSWSHRMFYAGMIPVYTEVKIAFTRIPDQYHKEGPSAAGASKAELYASGTGTGVGERDGGNDGSPGGLPPGSAGTPVKNGWTIPCRYVAITSPWGWRNLDGKPDFHYGIDLGAPFNEPVYAARDGKVIQNGFDGGRGNFITLEHKVGSQTYLTEYMHLNSRSPIKVGTEVKGGQAIGLVGSTGQSTGAHLHFEVYLGGQRIDPMKIIDFPGSVQ